MVLLITHPIFKHHNANGNGPENAERLSSILNSGDSLDTSVEEIYKDEDVKALITEGRKHAMTFHDSIYVKWLKDEVEKLKKLDNPDAVFYADDDTAVGIHSEEIASYALGLVKRYADIVADSGKNYFLAVRPPGHHAHYGLSSGFCLFNNAAFAAYTMLKKGKKVLVFDIDAHMGDGTLDFMQNGFYKDDTNLKFDSGNVAFISLQQTDLWRNQQDSYEKNMIIKNISGGSGDEEYMAVLKNDVIPFIEEFKPDAVVVSAGFDTCKHDLEIVEGSQLGLDMHLTAKSYSMIKDILSAFPTLYILEGGYNPKSVETGIKAITNL